MNTDAAAIATEHPHDKALYIITHAGLSSGEQTAQVAHAMADFCLQQPQLARKWHLLSEYLICLEAKDQAHLNQLLAKAHAEGLQYTSYQEPDYADATTAIALHPSAAVRKFASNLPCAGRSKRVQELLFQMARETEALQPYVELEGGSASIEWDCKWGGGHLVFNERKYGGYVFERPTKERLAELGITEHFDWGAVERQHGRTEYFDGRTANLADQWPAIRESLLRAKQRWNPASLSENSGKALAETELVAERTR